MKKLIGFALGAVMLVPCLAWGKVGGGDIVFRPGGAANVTFSHEDHVTKFGVKCRECHYKIYTTVEGHRRATMTDMQQGLSCGACHDAKRAFTVKASCERCHK